MNRIQCTPRALLAALLIPLGLLAACSNSSMPHSSSVGTTPPLGTRSLGTTDDLRIARGALESGDVQLASTLYDKALKADPKSVDANIGIGDCLFQTGDMERARVAYGRAAALAPDAMLPKLALARVALKQRRFEEATRLYRELLARTPNDPAAAAGLGTVLDLTGNHGEAQAVYRSALEQHPDAIALRIDLGLSYTLAGQPREGATILLDVASIADAPPQARQDLALAYGLLGNDAAAEKILLVDLPKNAVQDNLRYYARLRTAFASRGAMAQHVDPTASMTATPMPLDSTSAASVGAVPGKVAAPDVTTVATSAAMAPAQPRAAAMPVVAPAVTVKRTATPTPAMTNDAGIPSTGNQFGADFGQSRLIDSPR